MTTTYAYQGWFKGGRAHCIALQPTVEPRDARKPAEWSCVASVIHANGEMLHSRSKFAAPRLLGETGGILCVNKTHG